MRQSTLMYYRQQSSHVPWRMTLRQIGWRNRTATVKSLFPCRTPPLQTASCMAWWFGWRPHPRWRHCFLRIHREPLVFCPTIWRKWEIGKVGTHWPTMSARCCLLSSADIVLSNVQRLSIDGEVSRHNDDIATKICWRCKASNQQTHCKQKNKP